MKNPGRLFEIVEGTCKGKYCIAYNKEQLQHYLKQNKLFVHYYDDKQFKVPTRYADNGKYPADDGKKMLGIEKVTNLNQIGFND